jgi:hypothetical protein
MAAFRRLGAEPLIARTGQIEIREHVMLPGASFAPRTSA